MNMTIHEIFEKYVALQNSVIDGDVAPADALLDIETLQEQADAINAGFKFTRSLQDLEALVKEVPSGDDSYGFYVEGLPSEESSY
jgi:hypothetical protein